MSGRQDARPLRQAGRLTLPKNFPNVVVRFSLAAFTMPSKTANDVLRSSTPLLIGHRGCCALAPENTIPSFKLALEAGVDLIELDYHQSSDGVPMVIHDPTLDRTTNARKRWRRTRLRVKSKTARELSGLNAGTWFHSKYENASVPRLVDALEVICGAGAVALIEHKSGDPETLVRILREKNLVNRVVVISFNWKFLRDLHELEPDQVLGALGPPAYLMNGKRRRGLSRSLTVSWVNQLTQTGASLVVWNRHLPRPAIEHAHRLGLKVWVFTINEPHVARQLIGMGVHGIITNDPFQLASTVRGSSAA
jgi:glycerophosphoryl diester phosphodiesterase